MERFAFKIDKTLKANLYKICRLCGIDNPEKVNILADINTTANVDDGEPELWRKVQACIGFIILKDDKMPQTMCSLCVDKINDFFEFREMCLATNAQTRKLLGLKEEQKSQFSEVNRYDDFETMEALPSPVSKRGIFCKGKRKRKSDEALPKSAIETDVEEIKEEKSTSSPFGAPIRKKTKFTNIPNLVASAATTTITFGTSGAVLQSISKPLTSSQKRSFDQFEKKLKPKDEIKDEVTEISIASSTDSSSTISSMGAKVATGKMKQYCNICDQRFINKSQLERHRYAMHVPNIPRYVCTACNETIKKNNEIKNHQLWHKLSKTPFICGLCDGKLLNTYSYSRHLRDHAAQISTNVLVLDRQCPQCQHTFATNYLYNIHPCSLATKICAGCNRYQKNENEYLRHAPMCPKSYITHSNHISVASIAEESCIQIKNENDVEAAEAAQADSSLNMTPAVSMTLLNTPLLMQSNQCVLIPGHQVATNEDASMTPSTSNPKLLKKANKKGVSRKELKRVDDLLKSTMDTLVSIKHEPEVHMDTCEVMLAEAAAELPFTNENGEDDDMQNASSLLEDDFHDDCSDDDADIDAAMLASVIIKQELIEDSEKCEQSTLNFDTSHIKQEPVDPNKIPVLKLKITKEHGKLNSSLVEQEDNSKSEKKKKKKKRKDVEKEKERLNDESHLSVHRDASILMPQPGVIHIKQERLDDEEASAALIQTNPYRNEGHLQADGDGSLVMTTIPQNLNLQISCVSSGVDFSDGDYGHPVAKDVFDAHESSQMQEEDIKPCREDLDRLLQITHVSGGVELSQAERKSLESEQETQHQLDTAEKSPKKSKHGSSKTFKSTTGISSTETPSIALLQIVAISSGKEVNETFPESEQGVVVKEECFDVHYGDHVPQVVNENQLSATYAADCLENMRQQQQSPDNSPERHLSADHRNDEQEYISKIDFNNIIIKQEKDIEISEVEFNESVGYSDMMSNGLKTLEQKTTHKQEKYQYNRSIEGDAEYRGSNNDGDMDGEEVAEEKDDDDGDGDDDYDEDEEEEDDDEEYNVNINEDLEEREYRELEMPPMLMDDVIPAGAGNSENSIENKNKSDQHLRATPMGTNIDNLEKNTTSPLISNVAADASIESVCVQKVMTEFGKQALPTNANVFDTETIGVLIKQPADVELTAVPFHVPSSAATSLDGFLPELDQDSASEETNTNESQEFDSSEEMQNQLNHEMSVEQQAAPLLFPEHNTSSILHHTVAPETCSPFNISARLAETPSTSSSSHLALAPPKLNEETENLINESNDVAVPRFQPNDLLLLSQQSMFVHSNINNNNNMLLDDDSNINEIAENNNNANIERELQADSPSLNAAAIEPSCAEHQESNDDHGQGEAEEQQHGIT